MTIKQHGGVFGRNPTFNIATASQFIGPVSGLAASAAALKSSATTGLMQVTGPAAGATRIMTIPDANFTAARTDAAQSFTGDQTLTDGNLVVSNGKGIDFSATAGTGTSELFDDYEEGEWTPEFAIVGGSFSAITYNNYTGGVYTKIGNMVTITGYIATNSLTVGTGGNLEIIGLPFAVGNGPGLSTRSAVSIGVAANWSSGYPISGRTQFGTTEIFLQKRSAVDGATSAVQASDMGTTTQDNELSFSAVYFV